MSGYEIALIDHLDWIRDYTFHRNASVGCIVIYRVQGKLT